MINILFTCAGRRTYLLKYFKEQLGTDGVIIGADMQLSAPALTAADVKIQVPAVYDKNYVDKILKICEDYSVSAVISLNDLELPILSAAKERFDAIGAKLIVSRPEVIEICFDKYLTAKFIKSLGLNTPETFADYDEAVGRLSEGKLKFPVILKPRWGSGSIGIEVVNSIDELSEVYSMLKRKVKESILRNASVGDDYILIQEFIQGKEYGMDVMNDLEGNNLGVVVKQKLAMRSGETDKAVTSLVPEVVEMGEKLGRELKHIGNLDCDILERDGKYYVLEMNPRFGGGFPFSYEAGANYPKVIIDLLKGVQADTSLLKWTPGRMFAKCDYLVEIVEPQ